MTSIGVNVSRVSAMKWNCFKMSSSVCFCAYMKGEAFCKHGTFRLHFGF